VTIADPTNSIRWRAAASGDLWSPTAPAAAAYYPGLRAPGYQQFQPRRRQQALREQLLREQLLREQLRQLKEQQLLEQQLRRRAQAFHPPARRQPRTQTTGLPVRIPEHKQQVLAEHEPEGVHGVAPAPQKVELQPCEPEQEQIESDDDNSASVEHGNDLEDDDTQGDLAQTFEHKSDRDSDHEAELEQEPEQELQEKLQDPEQDLNEQSTLEERQVAQPVSAPAFTVTGGGEMDRKLSVMSEGAMNSVTALEAEVGLFTQRLAAIERRLGDALGRKQLAELKQSAAQIVGQLERFQEDRVDAIVTADLQSGKDVVRQHRKQLTAQVSALSEKAIALHGAADAALSQHQDR